ncbi:MAG TPA: NADH-quinone oxidoreductase subunit N [Cyclobacteriaceae bacterium]|nr:NADH-quinone oxidoreductase subunit N [Cyclobacteriaceae bacterium]
MQQITEQQYLQWLARLLPFLLPELLLVLTAVLIIFCSFWKKINGAVFFITLAGIIAHVAVLILSLSNVGYYERADDFLVFDLFSGYFKILVSVAAILTVVMSGRQKKMEYYFLLLTILLGADLLMASHHYIMILLSIEMMSIPSYILVAGLGPDKARAEAGWKFFLFGSVATAIMIFGMTYLFGATGVSFLESQSFTYAAQTHPTMFVVGGLMTLAGLFFKMTVAPFHLWAPDVYESVPSPIAAFLSVVPKLAGLFMVAKLLFTMNNEAQQLIDWSAVVAGFAMLSIIVGTLGAIGQTNARRMMAYSTIAHAGFLLTILATQVSSDPRPVELAIFYSIVFLTMNYATFMVIQVREERGGSVLYQDFGGMGYTAPISAVAITIAMVSLTGLPPVGGFMAKLLVFTELWKKMTAVKNPVFLALLVIGLLSTVASLFFYLKIPFYMYFRRSERTEPIKIPLLTNLLLLFLVALLLAQFIVPRVFELGY